MPKECESPVQPNMKQIWSDIESYNEHALMKLEVSKEWEWLECIMLTKMITGALLYWVPADIARDIPTAQTYLGATIKQARRFWGFGARTFRERRSGGKVATRWIVFETEDEAARHLHSTHIK